MHRSLSLALALVSAGLLGTATQASAQQTTTTPAHTATASKPDSAMWNMNPAERLLSKKSDLKLSDDQVKKLEKLQTKFAGQTLPDTGQAAYKARKEQSKEAMAVLTKEQQEKVHSMAAQHHAAWKAQSDSLHHTHHGGTAADTAKH